MIEAHAPIRLFMTPDPRTIGREQTIAAAAQRMEGQRIRHLPVLDGGRLVGVVSERDLAIVSGLAGVDPEVVRVEEAMTEDPYVVEPEAPLVAVIEAMAAHKFGTALVVDGGHLAGIFTTVDALRAFAERLRGG